ncbi:MAG: hypothetical protein JWR05_3442 [Mucilaginibacter sp.]|nr:hypothetical protein [Mucilaginibacter sp.]
MTTSLKTKVKVQIGITVVLGVFSIYLIITEPNNSEKLKCAYSIVGLTIGYC